VALIDYLIPIGPHKHKWNYLPTVIATANNVNRGKYDSIPNMNRASPWAFLSLGTPLSCGFC
jgi:hypothetical protein